MILIVPTLVVHLVNRFLGVKEMVFLVFWYFGIFLTRSRVFSCSINSAKRSFDGRASAIFGKVGRLASEETILQ